MNHILTIHHANTKFLGLQLLHIFCHSKSPTTIHLGYSSIKEFWTELEAVVNDLKELSLFRGFVSIKPICLDEIINQHGLRLDYLALHALKDSDSDDDFLIFMDGDAFPIFPDYLPFLTDTITDKYPLIAVSREENYEPSLSETLKPYPHPCFAAIRTGTWVKFSLSWDFCAPHVVTAGPILSQTLYKKGKSWHKLMRSNIFNVHPLFFGIYGDLIYHHGASSRIPIDSVDGAFRQTLIKDSSFEISNPDIVSLNQHLSDLIFEFISDDPSLISRYFVGKHSEELKPSVS